MRASLVAVLLLAAVSISAQELRAATAILILDKASWEIQPHVLRLDTATSAVTPCPRHGSR